MITRSSNNLPFTFAMVVEWYTNHSRRFLVHDIGTQSAILVYMQTQATIEALQTIKVGDKVIAFTGKYELDCEVRSFSKTHDGVEMIHTSLGETFRKRDGRHLGFGDARYLRPA